MIQIDGDRCLTSLHEFERACLTHLEEEQSKPNPDNALIALLCDAVRLKREHTELFRKTVFLAVDKMVLVGEKK